jgi:hypothetical protein
MISRHKAKVFLWSALLTSLVVIPASLVPLDLLDNPNQLFRLSAYLLFPGALISAGFELFGIGYSPHGPSPVIAVIAAAVIWFMFFHLIVKSLYTRVESRHART